MTDAEVARERADLLEEAARLLQESAEQTGDEWSTEQEIAWLRRLAAQSEALNQLINAAQAIHYRIDHTGAMNATHLSERDLFVTALAKAKETMEDG